LFETAVLKAAMPQEDYDIESLIGRIAALEKQISEGNFVQNAVGRVEVKEEKPKAEPPAPKKVETVEEYTPIFEAPPDEEQTGGNVYFGGFEPPAPVKPKAEVAPTPVKAVKPTVSGGGKATFGGFLRTIRKIARNGVLLTLCMDLDGEYDGDVFALYTTSDTIYRSLTKPEHYALIGQAFAEMGLAEGQFAIRLRGKQSDNFQKTVNEIKATFEGVPVEIK
jgi:hypothetical protein